MTVLLRIPVAARPWLGAVLISFSGVWVRLADVEPARSAFLRSLYALPVLAVLVWWHGRRGGATSGAARPAAGGRAGRWLVPTGVAAGVLLGLDLVAWHASIGIIGAGLGTVLPNLQVVFVGLFGVWLLRERPTAGFWVGVPTVLAGVWLLSALGEPIETGGSVTLGVLLGVLTGLFYAGSLLVLRWSRRRVPAAGAPPMLWSLTLGATAATGLVAAGQGVAAPAGWPADGWLLALALGSQVVGWLLVTSSIHVLPAAATSVALLLQPVLALVWGAALLGEPLGLAQVAGASVVLAGVAIAHRSVRNVTPPDGTSIDPLEVRG